MSRARAPLAFALFLPCFGIAAAGLLDCALADPQTAGFWHVDDVRAGMKGSGTHRHEGHQDRDVRRRGPRRPARTPAPAATWSCAGCPASTSKRPASSPGMSGSPVYIDGKLLGAVAYAWPFGKEPIAGITPFCQMHELRRGLRAPRPRRAEAKPRRIGLAAPLHDRRQAVRHRDGVATTSSDAAAARRRTACGWCRCGRRWPPPASRRTACRCCATASRGTGMVPMQGGARRRQDRRRGRRTPRWSRAGRWAWRMVTGDFDMSGIGTVTHIEGKRVYGWGHPFFGLGACEFPLMTGYIHTIYPRQSVSFKMGSPLKTVGVINADVSTCIAGWLDRKPDMLPVSMTVSCATASAGQDVQRQDRPPALACWRPLVHTGADQLRRHGRRLARGNDRRPQGSASTSRATTPVVIKRHLLRLQLFRRPGAAGAVRARSASSCSLLTYNTFRTGPHQARSSATTRILAGPAHRGHRGGRAGLRDLRSRARRSRRPCSCGRTRACGSGCR